MELGLAGRVALVTGAGSGIGRAIALALAMEGVKVWCADQNLPAAEATIAAGDGSAPMMAAQLDVTDSAAAVALCQRIGRQDQHLDILVNSAGIIRTGLVQDMSPHDWTALERVNLGGTLWCAKAAIPLMSEHRYGRIINISSVSAFKGGGSLGNTLYGATKAGVAALTMGLARELGPSGITVNAIAPAVIRTGMTDSFIDHQRESDILARIPVGRLGTAQDTAMLCLFLASEGASFITGAIIPVDGGLLTT